MRTIVLTNARPVSLLQFVVVVVVIVVIVVVSTGDGSISSSVICLGGH